MITFREAKNSEDEILKDLLAELQEYEKQFEPYYRPGTEVSAEYLAYIRRECAEHDGKIIVALDDQKIVGFICVWRGELLDQYVSESIEIGYISDLIVTNAYRKQGVGSQLIAQAEEYAHQKKLRMLKIGSLSRNTDSKELYRKLGYLDFSVQLVKDFSQKRV
jgi:ribosomal protein S18 acetylase RimI-like enzyme